MSQYREHQKALDKTKIQLMAHIDTAFFTTVCFSLKHLWDESIPTACTNGYNIRFNPDFFLRQSPEERLFLLLHEVLHVCYQHMTRLQERDPQKWNIAADHVINLQLFERGFRMPQGGCADPQYKGLSTEEVYKLLPDADYSANPMDIESPDQSPEELSEHLAEIIVRASVQSKIQGDTSGTIPGEVQIFLDKLLTPKLPWQRILQKYLHSLSKSDYSFRKFNRRFFPKYHLPSLHSETLMAIAIAVDTSGSVSDTEFNQFVTEIHSILRMQKPEKITLIQFDTAIKAVDEIRSVKELSKVEFHGRGGTRIEPVLQWAETNKPQLLLVFSDGHFRFYREGSRTNVVWLIHNNAGFEPPFGKLIKYQLEV